MRRTTISQLPRGFLYVMASMYTKRWTAVVLLLLHSLSIAQAWTPADQYVSLFVSVFEVMLTALPLQNQEVPSPHRHLLALQTAAIRAEIEAVKIELSKHLRDSFAEKHPDLASEGNDDKLLPYFVSKEAEQGLLEQGYRTLNSHAAENGIPRKLFDFPVVCAQGGCDRGLICWGISLALDGLSMEETCDLLEKFQNLGGEIVLEDLLAELPELVASFSKVESILGTIKIAHCQQLFIAFDQVKDVYYYPKAICDSPRVSGGCLAEIWGLLVFVLQDPIGGVLPANIYELLELVQEIVEGARKVLPKLCLQVLKLDYFATPPTNASLLMLFDQVPALSKTRLELLIEILNTLRSIEFARNYLPEIPQGCKHTLVTIAHNIYEEAFKEGADLPLAICRSLASNEHKTCLGDLLINLDKVEWIVDSIGNGQLHVLMTDVIDPLCKTVRTAQGLSVSVLLESLPEMIRMYKRLNSPLLQELLPSVHPVLVSCNHNLTVLAKAIAVAHTSIPDLAQAMCFNVARNGCLVKLSDGLDNLTFAVDAIGEGTLATVVEVILPHACTYIHALFGSDGQIALEGLLTQLPQLLETLEHLNAIEALKDILPPWPKKACNSSVVHDISSALRSNDILQAVCAMDTAPLTACLTSFGRNLDTTKLTRELFEARVSRQGAQTVLKRLLGDVFPAICSAFSSSHFDISSLIASIPSLLKAYRQLDIVVLRDIYPLVHESINGCVEDLSGLAVDIAAALDGDDVMDSMLSLICSTIAENACLIKLSTGLDSVALVTDQVGTGALAAVVETTLPGVCEIVGSTTEGLSVDNVLWHVEDLLDLMAQLHEQNVLQNFIPEPPSSECRQRMQSVATEPSLDNLCLHWPDDGTFACLTSFSDNVDKVGMLRDILGEGFLRSFIEEDLSKACSLLQSFSADGLSVEVIAHAIEWYLGLYEGLPKFAQELLPAYPDEDCPQELVADTLGDVISGDVLDKVCGKAALAPLKQCMVSLDAKVNEAAMVRDALGWNKGFLSGLIDDVSGACRLIVDNSGAFSPSAILQNFAMLIEFISHLRSRVPAILQSYLPVIPLQCSASYDSISLRLSQDSVEQLPAAVCNLPAEDINCLGMLGDSLDAVEFIAHIIGRPGLVRHVLNIIQDVACPTLEGLQELQPSKLAAYLSGALQALSQLNAYPVLEPLLPVIPGVCNKELSRVEKETAGVDEVVDVVCALSTQARDCLTLLSRELEKVSWANEALPNASKIVEGVLELAPVVCGVLRGDVAVDVVLMELPAAVVLVRRLGDVELISALIPQLTEQCYQRFYILAQDVAELSLVPTEIPRRMCRMENSTKLCVLQVVRRIDAIPDEVATDLLAVLPTVCSLLESLKMSIRPEAIIPHLPDVFHVVTKLTHTPMVSEYLPEITSFCSSTLSSVLSNRSRMDLLLSDPASFVCSLHQEETTCVKEIVVDALQISVVQATLPGAMVAAEQLFVALPHGCGIYSSLLHGAKEMDLGTQVLDALPSLLQLMNDLASIPLLSGLVPAVPSECVERIPSSLRRGFASGRVINGTCLVVRDQPFGQCCIEFAKSLDEVGHLKSMLNVHIPAATLVAMAFSVLQRLCSSVDLEQVLRDLRPQKVLQLFPQLLDVYVDVQAEYPSVLPLLNESQCDTMGGFLAQSSNPITLVCGMQLPELSCLYTIVETIEQVPYLGGLLGRRGMVKDLVDSLLHSVCSLIQGGEMSMLATVESVMSHVDVILEVVDHLHHVAPTVVGDYLPRVPIDCSSHLVQLARVATKPHELCALPETHFKCLAELGDEIESVPFVAGILWGDEKGQGHGLIRMAVELMNVSICPAFTGMHSLNMTHIIAEVPRVFTLVEGLRAYPFLRDFVPEMPRRCSPAFEQLSKRLHHAAYMDVLCSLDSTVDRCMRAFGKGLADVTHSGVEGVIGGLLDLLPQVCDMGVSLGVLPQVMRVYIRVEDVLTAHGMSNQLSVKCQELLLDYTVFVAENQNELPFSLCDGLHKGTAACIKELGDNLESMPVVGSAMPNGVVQGVAQVVANGTLCEMLGSVRTMDYNGFVVALPLAMQTLSQLEAIPVLSEFVPKISSGCKHTISTSVAKKIESFFGDSSATAVESTSTGLDLSPLTGLLCGYTDAEEACLHEVAVSFSTVEALDGLVREWTGQGLEMTVEAGLDVKDNLCTVLRFLGDRQDWGGILTLLPHILRLIDGLSRLPGANVYIPAMPSSCDAVLQQEEATPLGSLEEVCRVDERLVHCAVDVAVGLDTVTEVRRLFFFASGSAVPISQHVSQLLLHDMPEACLLADEITVRLDDGRVEDVLPKVSALLVHLSKVPLINSFIPRRSPHCQAFLSTYSSPLPFCSMSAEDRECVKQMEVTLQDLQLLPVSLPAGVLASYFSMLSENTCAVLQGHEGNLTKFIEKDLVNGLIIAGRLSGVGLQSVNAAEEAKSSGHAWTVCEMSIECREEYVQKVRRTRVLGKLVQESIVDAVDALCNTLTGIAPLKVLAARSVPIALSVAGEGCESKAVGVDDICGIGEECLEKLAKGLKDIPGDLTSSLVTLLHAACEFSKSDRSGEELIRLMPMILQVVGDLFQTSCAHDYSVAAQTLQSEPAVSTLCSAVRYSCIHELVSSLRKLPFLAPALPEGIEELIASTCAVANNAERFSVLQEHLPVLFKLVQKFSGTSSDDACQGKIDRLLFDRYGNFHVNYLCALRQDCQRSLVDSLQGLPLVGDRVPEVLVEVLEQMCAMYRRVPSGRIPLKLLPEFLPKIVHSLGRLISPDERCLQAFDGVEKQDLCSDMNQECLQRLSERVGQLPLVGQMLPKRTGEVMQVICSGGSLKDRLIDVMAIVGDLIAMEAECSNAFADVAVRFRLYDSLDGDVFCNTVPSECVSKAARGVMTLPVIKSVLPRKLDVLLNSVCSVTATNVSLETYINTRGTLLVKLSSFMVGLTETCHSQLERLDRLDELCSVDPPCIDAFVEGFHDLPLIGSNSPESVLNLLTTFCRVQHSTDVQAVLSQELSQVLLVAAPELRRECVHQVRRVGVSFEESGQLNTEALCQVDSGCLDELLERILHLPLVGKVLPATVAKAVGEACSLQAAEDLGEIFSKHITPLADLVTQLAISPSDECKDEIEEVATEKNPSLGSLCERLSEGCMVRLIEGYRTIPLVTEMVDARLDLLMQVGCAVVREGVEVSSSTFDRSFLLVEERVSPDGCEALVNSTVEELVCQAPRHCVEYLSKTLFDVPLLGEELSKVSNVSAFEEQLRSLKCPEDAGVPVWIWAAGAGSLGIVGLFAALLCIVMRKRKKTKTVPRQRGLVKVRNESIQESAVVPRMVDIDFE